MAKNDRFNVYLNEMFRRYKTRNNHPVSVTEMKPLAPFARICNNMVMYINSLFCITLCVLTVLFNETILLINQS